MSYKKIKLFGSWTVEVKTCYRPITHEPWGCLPLRWRLTCPLRRSCWPQQSTFSWQHEAPVGSSLGPRRLLLFCRSSGKAQFCMTQGSQRREWCWTAVTSSGEETRLHYVRHARRVQVTPNQRGQLPAAKIFVVVKAFGEKLKDQPRLESGRIKNK